MPGMSQLPCAAAAGAIDAAGTCKRLRQPSCTEHVVADVTMAALADALNSKVKYMQLGVNHALATH